MHPLALKSADLLDCFPTDPWSPTLIELEDIAQVVVGASRDHWVRQGSEWVLAAKIEFGSLAPKLADEFSALATEVKSIVAERVEDAVLRAAAFYHLRFERIHPLFDGNGRVGRALLAMQCSTCYGVPLAEMLSQLDAHENDYKGIHPARKPEFQFELLVDLLARILAVPACGEVKLPFPLEPRYPDRRIQACWTALNRKKVQPIRKSRA